MINPDESTKPARWRSAPVQGWFYIQLLPWLVLAVSLVVTYQLWKNAQHNAMQALQTQFDYRVLDVADDINKRMETYMQVMRGVDGLFAHASIVERSEFHDYIARLRLKENYPGIQAIRYAPLVREGEKDKHVTVMRKEGFAGYNIYPEGRRDFYAPVIYAEPYDERNKVVFGYDMLSDREYPRAGEVPGMRSAAMAQARDSGQATISGKIKLLFEKEQDAQAGFLIFMPVYRHDAPHGTLVERRANLVGWIASAFRMGDLMNGILGDHANEVDIDLYDGEQISASSLMHDPDRSSTNEKEGDTNLDTHFRRSKTITVAGHKWTLMIRSLPLFETTLNTEKAKTAAYTGIAVSLMLAFFTWLLVMSRERALQAAAMAERASRKNETLLRTASDGIYIFDINGKVVQANDTFCRMLGYTQEEMLGMNVAQWNTQWPKEELMERINALGVSNPVFETLHRRRDGSIINVEISASRVEIDGQQLVYNSARDITERKQAAEALRQSEAQLRLLLDSAAEAIYGTDLHGNCTFCNPSCLRLLGYQQAEDLIGKNMHQLIHHKHADETLYPVEECRIYRAFLMGINTHADDEVFWRADGTSFPVEYWSHPQFRGGVAVGAVITFLDITERVLANEKLLKLSRAVENSPASVVITDVNGTIEYVNKRFTAVTGYLAQEAAGQNPRLLNAGIQTKEFYKEMWATILAGKEWEGDIYNKKKSGEVYLEHAFISPIRDDKGIVTHFVAVKEDITKRKQTEQELQKAMATAEAANRAKGNFLANMSHEIRTPMNAIIGLSHLCMQTKLTAKQHDYLHKVHASAKTLLGIINDVLDFSKIEAGKMDVEQVRFELEEVMGNLAAVISTKAEEKGLEFLFETSLDVYPHMIGDPLRLGQVLINLASNAVKFTDKGEVLVLTELEEETAEHVSLRFTVRDTGIGMTQEQIGKLFQAFSQADTTTTRKFGGTGLGLSISKRIVDLMNGKIWVESTPGKGSKFIFTARFGKAVERRARKRLPPSIDLRGMRVLAVDDNASCRHILQSYLESFDFKVTEAVSGFEALQAIEETDRNGMPYQFVVLDWKMPEMNGIEAARKIHEMSWLSKRPKILLISSFSHNEMLQHVEGNVVDGILGKPFQQSELFDATMEIFGRAEVRGRRNAVTALFHPDLAARISGAYLLLAEDNEINQQIARELLEKAGVTVAIVENGEEAIARLWEEKFDGVLMDMQMPVMDGITATREIRKNPRLADLPIIAMTANVLAGDREQCLTAGMNDHITKPLDPNQMMATLAKWIIPAQPASHAPEAVQGPEDLPNLPGVRVAEGVRRMGDSIAGYYAILEKFRSGRQDTLAEIRSAIAADDWKKAERLAHTMNGLLGTLGADKLKGNVAELEAAIRGKANVRIESLLPSIELKLTKLFDAIDRALLLRAAEKKTDVEVADQTGPINIEELTNLVCQAKSQLEEFDSRVEDTVARMRQMVGSDAAMKNALVSIERHVSSYNYEQGLAELTDYAKSMGISCGRKWQA